MLETELKQLGEVVKETETAANSIMNSADEIRKIAQNVDVATARKLEAIATKIYEACSFQDLTGQRIKNIRNKLTLVSQNADCRSAPLESERTYEQSLMNGPQFSGSAPGQSEVDNMFKNAPLKKN